MARLSNPSEGPKVSRAIRLDKDLDEQLMLVCRTLGVNPNAYLRQVVGESINKHMAQYRIEQGLINSVTAQMEKMMTLMAMKEQEPEENNSHSD
ncbi:MAG: hypothetical protein ACRC2U_00040 [Aeromonas sp.]